MECWEVTEKICSFLDGELDQDDSGVLERHLTICPSCKYELESIKKLNSLLIVLPSMRVASQFARGVVKRILSEEVRQYNFIDWWKSLTLKWKVAAYTTALIGLLIGGSLAKFSLGPPISSFDTTAMMWFNDEVSIAKSYNIALIAGDR